MTAPTRPPRPEGLRTLAPELARIVEALARVQEERDHLERAKPPQEKPHDAQR